MASYLLKCSDEEKAAWQAAAQAEGVSLAAWIRRRLNSSHGPIVKVGDVVHHVSPPAFPASKACQHGLPAGFCLNPACK